MKKRHTNSSSMFGLPSSVVSDPNSCFPSHSWQSLWTMIDTKLKQSTTFHPQTDGQTEVINHLVIHLLGGYNSRHSKTWDETFHICNLPFNCAMHSSMEKSTFEVCLVFQPQSFQQLIEALEDYTVKEWIVFEKLGSSVLFEYVVY